MGYYITVPDLKGCSTWITSLTELEQILYEAKLAWIGAALEKGLDIPKPTEKSKFSGKFLVRCPRTIHKRLVENAKREGISLNQYIVSILAENSLGDRAVEIVKGKVTKVIEESFAHGMKFAEWKFAEQWNLSNLNPVDSAYFKKYSVEEEAKIA